MTTKDKLKREIDQMSDDLIEEIYKIVNTIKAKKTRKRKIHTHRLHGSFDDIDIRTNAYE